MAYVRVIPVLMEPPAAPAGGTIPIIAYHRRQFERSMAGILKQSTAVDVLIGPFVDSTDGDTEETALTIAQADVRLSKNGQTAAQKSDVTSCAHDADGFYNCELDATDTNTVGQLTLYVHVAGALAVRHDFQVMEEATYDALYGASAAGFDANGRVDVGSWLGTAVTTSSTTSKPEVDVNSISDDATSANNLELDYDGTGYAKANSTIGTCTTNTDMITAAAVNAEVDTALADIGLDHLISAAVVGTDVTDNSIIAKMVSKSATADWDSFVNTTDALEAIRDKQTDIETDTAEIGAAGAGLTAVPWNAAWDAEVESECNDALVAQGLDHLVAAAVTGTDVADNSIIADLVSASATSDYDDYVNTTDSLQAIRDRGDAAWTTGAGGSDRLLMVDTTIATLSSQTSFTLTDGSTDDDAYNNCTIVVEDVSTSAQKCVGLISDYTGSTKTVTLKYDPGIFVMAATDKVYVLAENALKSTDANRQLDVTATGAAGIDWGNVENPTTAVDLSATDIQLCDTITTYTGNTVQTGDAFARLGAPAGASVSADVAAVKVDTAATLADTGTDGVVIAAGQTVDTVTTLTGHTAQTGDSFARLGAPAGASVSADIAAIEAQTDDIGVAGAGLTAVPWNAAWDAEVQSEVDDALVAQGLDHLVGAAAVGTDVTDNSIIAKLVSSSATADFDDFVNTTDSLQAIRDKQTDIETDTAEIGSAGAGLTGIPWNAAWDAEVQSEVDDSLATAQAELSAVPGSSPTLIEMVQWIYQLMKHKSTSTATTITLFKDDGTTSLGTSTVSDDATTFTRGEFS